MSIMLTLPNGQRVNLCTNEGASAFFSISPNFVSMWIEQATEIRGGTQTNNHSNNSNCNRKTRDKQNKLIVVHQLLGVMAESLTPKQLETLDVDDYKCLVDFIKSRFSEISATPSWRSTGILSKPDQELLDAVVPWLKHVKFVQLMMTTGGFQVLAELVQRDDENNNKPSKMPIPEVTETILMITNNAILTIKSNPQVFSSKKALAQLEETDLLGQALRCLTVPVTYGSLQQYLQIVDSMEKDACLIRNKLTPGTRTGNILEGLLSGVDSWPPRSNPYHAQVMKRLDAMQKLAIMASNRPENKAELDRICRHCGKTGYEMLQEQGTRLLQCSKCKSTYYCGKSCQRADWEQHKRMCNPFRAKLPVQNIIASFIQQHYVPIMTEMKETCEENGLGKRDMFLEIDFCTPRRNDDGVSPGMDGEFRIAPVYQALEEDRPAEPDWFYKGTDVYESNVFLFREGLRDHHSRMTPKHVLVVYRGTDGHAGVYRVDVMSEKTGFHICSDEALDLFPQDTLEKRMKLISLQSSRQPVGGESEEDLKMFIETFGAAMSM